MKSKIILIILLVCSAQTIFSQPKRKLDIYLTNGKIIVGSLIVQSPQLEALIKISDSLNVVVPMNEIKKAIPFKDTNSDSMKRIVDYSYFVHIPESGNEIIFPPLNYSILDTTREFIYHKNRIEYGDLSFGKSLLSKEIDKTKLVLNDSIEVDTYDVLAYFIEGYGLYVRLPENDGMVQLPKMIYKNGGGYFIRNTIKGKIFVYEGPLNIKRGLGVGFSTAGGLGVGTSDNHPTYGLVTTLKGVFTSEKYYRLIRFADTDKLLEFEKKQLLPALLKNETAKIYLIENRKNKSSKPESSDYSDEVLIEAVKIYNEN